MQSPIALQRENYTMYVNDDCKAVDVSCDATSLADGNETNPQDNVRLISTTGAMNEKAGHVDSEGFLTVHNFAVTNSQGVETSQWHNTEANTTKG